MIKPRVGLVQIRRHCKFSERPNDDGMYAVEVLDHHCAECIADLKGRGYMIMDKRTDEPTIEFTKPDPEGA